MFLLFLSFTAVLGNVWVQHKEYAVCFDTENGSHDDLLSQQDTGTKCKICVANFWDGKLQNKRCETGIEHGKTSDCISMPKTFSKDKNVVVTTDCHDGLWINALWAADKKESHGWYWMSWGNSYNSQGWCLSRDQDDWNKFGKAKTTAKKCYRTFKFDSYTRKVYGWTGNPNNNALAKVGSGQAKSDPCPQGYDASTKNVDGSGKKWSFPEDIEKCAATCDTRSGCTSFEYNKERHKCGTYTGGASNVSSSNQKSGWQTCLKNNVAAKAAKSVKKTVKLAGWGRRRGEFSLTRRRRGQLLPAGFAEEDHRDEFDQVEQGEGSWVLLQDSQPEELLAPHA